jgi:serine/threonine-protein kinase
VAKNGRVKLVDFGLGRVLVEASGDGDETLARGRMTPTWASPEQARGEPVTTRSEVYQLGLVLYRLLTNHSPYDVDASTPWTIAQAIAEARIAPPSEAWRDPRAEADGFDRPAASLRRRLRGDLDNIVLKALAVEPGRRYAGVDELAEDLRRHLASEPVRARAATRRYRLSRFVQRNRAAVAGGGAFVLLLVASLVVFGFQSRALQIERDRAVENAARSERLVEAMAGMIRLSDAENAVEQLYSLGDLLDRYVDYVRTELDQDPLERARLLGILGQAMHGIDRWAPAREVISLALAETERLVGPSSEAVQDLRSLLAEATAFDGNLDEAVRLLDAVERSAVRREGPVSETVADTVYLRGFLRAHHAIRGSRQYRQGLADLERALMLYRDMFEDPHAKIAKAMHALGFKLDDPQRRLEMVENGLSMTRELVGTEHPVYAMRLAELALVHDGDGNDAEAAMIGRRAYDIHARIQGETHPESMTMLSNLAGFHREAGNLERAVTLYRDLHQIRQQTLPEDHLLLAFTAHGLGNTLRMLGDHSESERWLREALRLCLLHESRNEAVTRENLARTLEAAGRLPAALEQQRRAVAAYRRHFGESSAAVNTARQRLESMQPGG